MRHALSIFSVCMLCVVLPFGCSRTDPAELAKTETAKGNSMGQTTSKKLPSRNPSNVPTVDQQPSSGVQPVAEELKVELGYAENRPVLFFELHTGLFMRFSDIMYDEFGWVGSYQASILPGKRGEAKVLVRTETQPSGGKAPNYAATVNGKPVPSKNDKTLVGFSVKDTGGIVLASSMGTGPINVQTKFSYDSTGRQDTAQQAGQHEGKAMAITTKFSYGPTGRQDVAQQDGQLGGKLFVITYSDYRMDELGRLTGYTAQVVKAE
jgi:hypothetical protein